MMPSASPAHSAERYRFITIYLPIRRLRRREADAYERREADAISDGDDNSIRRRAVDDSGRR